jgi:hypothetical protein
LTHLPSDQALGLDPLDRLPGAIERRQDGLLKQRTLALMTERDALQLRHALDDLARRHRLRRLAQHAVDQP